MTCDRSMCSTAAATAREQGMHGRAKHGSWARWARGKNRAAGRSHAPAPCWRVRSTHPGWSGGGWRGAAGRRRHLPGSAPAPGATGWLAPAACSREAATATPLRCGPLRLVRVGWPQRALRRHCLLNLLLLRWSSARAGCGGHAKSAALPCRHEQQRRRRWQRQGSPQRGARLDAVDLPPWSDWHARTRQRPAPGTQPSRLESCRSIARDGGQRTNCSAVDVLLINAAPGLRSAHEPPPPRRRRAESSLGRRQLPQCCQGSA